MVLLKKKTVGIGLVLLGGVMIAHGGATAQTWDTLLGSALAVIGVTLLAMKIIRRNAPEATRADQRS